MQDVRRSLSQGTLQDVSFYVCKNTSGKKTAHLPLEAVDGEHWPGHADNIKREAAYLQLAEFDDALRPHVRKFP